MITTINEYKVNEANKSNVKFRVKSSEVRIHKDSYSEGETDLVTVYDLDLHGEFNNINELMEELSSIYPYIDFTKDKMVIMDNRLIITDLIHNPDNPETIVKDTEEYAEWKANKLPGFTIDIDMVLSVYKKEVINNTKEISKVLGISNYDY